MSGRTFDYTLLNTQVTGNELITGGKAGFEGSLILTSLTVLAIVLLEVILLKRDAENPKDTPVVLE